MQNRKSVVIELTQIELGMIIEALQGYDSNENETDTEYFKKLATELSQIKI